MLGFDIKFPAVRHIAKFRRFLVKLSSKTFHIKLGKIKKIPDMLGFQDKFPAVHPIAKFRYFLVKI